VRISRVTFGAVVVMFLFAQPVLWGLVHAIGGRLGVSQQWRVDLLISLALLAVLVVVLAGRYKDAGRSPLWALLQGVILLVSAIAAWWGFAGRLGIHQSGWHPHLSEDSGWYALMFLGGLAVGALDLIALTLCGLLARPIRQGPSGQEIASNRPASPLPDPRRYPGTSWRPLS
jgi:uncharacterized membrane protein YhaH (DUF805 family)